MNTFAFLTAYSRQFGKLTSQQAQGLNEIFTCFRGDQLLANDIRKVAYFLATVKHECADTWHPIQERGGEAYFVRRYWDNTRIRQQLGNTTSLDAVRYCGRGYVQLTGRRNYELVQRVLGFKVLESPTLLNDPKVSFAVAAHGMTEGWFTSRKLGDYIKPGSCDYLNARRVINGQDKTELIAGYANRLERILTGTFERL